MARRPGHDVGVVRQPDGGVRREPARGVVLVASTGSTGRRRGRGRSRRWCGSGRRASARRPATRRAGRLLLAEQPGDAAEGRAGQRDLERPLGRAPRRTSRCRSARGCAGRGAAARDVGVRGGQERAGASGARRRASASSATTSQRAAGTMPHNVRRARRAARTGRMGYDLRRRRGYDGAMRQVLLLP